MFNCSGSCEPRLDAGEACSTDQDCKRHFRCLDDRCTRLGEEGDLSGPKSMFVRTAGLDNSRQFLHLAARHDACHEGVQGRVAIPCNGCYNSSMSKPLTVRRIGNSYGVILGRDLLTSLGLEEGDEVFVVRTPEGIRLTPYDPDFAEAVEAGRDYMHRHRNAMRELAK